jgi:membrane fusion protein (multidrug efflux system)
MVRYARLLDQRHRSNQKKQMHRILVIALAALGIGGLGWWAYQSQRAGPRPAVEIAASRQSGPAASESARSAGAPSPGQGAGSAAGGADPARPVGVEAARAQVRDLADEVLAVGTLRANESVIIKPEISGRIVAIGFTDGARVARGQLLLRLDDSVLAAQVEQARAELGLARTSFERTEDLAKRNYVSGSARDQAAATLKVQAARLELAQAQLAKTRIVAPFAGVLGLRNVSVGDVVKDGAELVMLEDVSSMKVDLRLPERFLGQLRKGQSIRLLIDAFPGREFTARLDALDAQVDANGRSLLARGVLPNPDASLRAGMFAKARIVLREKPAAIVVPEEAILPSGGQASVFRVVDGKAVRTRVETGMRLDGKVEILSGVAGGELVVTAGQLRLRRDAMPVTVTEQPASGAGAGSAASTAPANGTAVDKAPPARKPGA